jgi:ankyrin repeat protein
MGRTNSAAQDKFGRTALMWASFRPHKFHLINSNYRSQMSERWLLSMTAFLVQNGRNDVNITDCDGKTALDHAVGSGNTSAIAALIKGGATSGSNLSEVH